MKFLLLLVFLGGHWIGFSQNYGNHPEIKKALLLQDLELLYQGLDQYHSGLYWYTPKDSIALAFQAAKKRISKDLNVLEFHKIIAPLVALSREDHTNVFLPEAVKERLGTQGKFFPFTVVLLDGALYMVKNGTSKNLPLTGKKVLSINGQSITEIVDQIGSLFASDGYIKTVKYSDLEGFEFAKYYYYFYGQVPSFEVVFEQETHHFDALPLDSIRHHLKQRYPPTPPTADPETLVFEILNDSTAYLGLHTFDNGIIRENSKNKHFKRFLAQSFQTIQKANIRHLVVDLSENGGGNEGNENLVFSYLGDDYQKYKKVRAKTQKAVLDNGVDPPITLRTFGFWEKWLANKRLADGSYERKPRVGFGLRAYQKKPAHPFEGQLYVLIGPVTYSGGSELANMLYTNGLGTFIGQETGGGYQGNTSGYSAELELPHSKITIDIPALQFVMNVNEDLPFGRGVLPHVKVVPTFEQYQKGENAALVRALQLIADPE